MGMLKRINYYQDRNDFHMERTMLLQRKIRYEKIFPLPSAELELATKSGGKRSFNNFNMKELKRIIILIFIVLFPGAGNLYAQANVDWKKVSVLVYTKNGKGYVHENIPSAVS